MPYLPSGVFVCCTFGIHMYAKRVYLAYVQCQIHTVFVLPCVFGLHMPNAYVFAMQVDWDEAIVQDKAGVAGGGEGARLLFRPRNAISPPVYSTGRNRAGTFLATFFQVLF